MTDPHIEYERKHAVCPVCGGWPGEQTCVGYIMTNIEGFEDLNKVWCAQCDWSGVIHDLVPERETHAARIFARFK